MKKLTKLITASAILFLVGGCANDFKTSTYESLREEAFATVAKRAEVDILTIDYQEEISDDESGDSKISCHLDNDDESKCTGLEHQERVRARVHQTIEKHQVFADGEKNSEEHQGQYKLQKQTRTRTRSRNRSQFRIEYQGSCECSKEGVLEMNEEIITEYDEYGYPLSIQTKQTKRLQNRTQVREERVTIKYTYQNRGKSR